MRAWRSHRGHDFSAVNDTGKPSPCVTAASPVITLNPIMITSLYDMLWPRDQYIKRADCQLRSGQDGWSPPGWPQAEATGARPGLPAPGQNRGVGGMSTGDTQGPLTPPTGVSTEHGPGPPVPPTSQARRSHGRGRPALGPVPRAKHLHVVGPSLKGPQLQMLWGGGPCRPGSEPPGAHSLATQPN